MSLKANLTEKIKMDQLFRVSGWDSKESNTLENKNTKIVRTAEFFSTNSLTTDEGQRAEQN